MKSARRTSTRKIGKAVKRKLDDNEPQKDKDVEAIIKPTEEEIWLAWSPVKLVRIPEM